MSSDEYQQHQHDNPADHACGLVKFPVLTSYGVRQVRHDLLRISRYSRTINLCTDKKQQRHKDAQWRSRGNKVIGECGDKCGAKCESDQNDKEQLQRSVVSHYFVGIF